MERQERMRQFAAFVLFILAVFGGYKLLHYWQESRTAEKAFSEISQQFHQGPTKYQDPIGSTWDNTTLARMEDLLGKNRDLYAWIDVEGTNIDYPVMFTPDHPEYYLRRNFEKQYSTAGTPFVDGRNTPDMDNCIIYGHNMKSGSMFADLLRYKDPDYFAEHSELRFTTRYEEKYYEVIAAFPSEVHQDRNTFPWFDYLNFGNEAEFQEFVSQLKDESLYDLPADLVLGDQFLTLVTCSYHDSTGRFIVIGRELKEKVAADAEMNK